MSNDTQKADLLRRAFAPWDERALESLAEAHPDTAAAVAELIAEGLIEPDELRRYAVEQGYLESTGAWLARAAAHVRRRAGSAEDGRPAEPAAPKTAAPPNRPRPAATAWSRAPAAALAADRDRTDKRPNDGPATPGTAGRRCFRGVATYRHI